MRVFLLEISLYLAVFLIGWFVGFGMAIYATYRRKRQP